MTDIDLDNPFAGIDTCSTHPQRMDDLCSYCQTEFAAKKKIHERLAQKVQSGFENLGRQGMGFPPDFFLGVRLELLIESILQDRSRMHFEVETALRLLKHQDEAKKQVTRATLLAPGGPHPSQGVPPSLHRVK